MRSIFAKVLLTLIFLKLLLTSYNATAEDLGIQNLSTEIRNLLQKEMVAIDSAMKDIISANAIGDYKKVASIANQIKESFILKKSLTSDQKRELHSKLPSDFLSRDQEFHYMAGMLSHAAANNKPELIGFYYSKLFEACSSCHKLHAKHKFTKFASEIKTHKH